MADIRMVRPPTSRLWLWMGGLAFLGILLWASALVFGDPTEEVEHRLIGAAMDVGAGRAPVIPPRPVPLADALPLEEEDRGRYVLLQGVIEAGPRADAIWVRAAQNRRIMARIEPRTPESGALSLRPGATVALPGYVERIARTEFNAMMDSLGVRIPRPPPGRKFGDLPPPEFMALDSLLIRTYYISIRPEALARPAQED
jgi:hypothetical protein